MLKHSLQALICALAILAITAPTLAARPRRQSRASQPPATAQALPAGPHWEAVPHWSDGYWQESKPGYGYHYYWTWPGYRDERTLVGEGWYSGPPPHPPRSVQVNPDGSIVRWFD